jgi:hypothetical protein
MTACACHSADGMRCQGLPVLNIISVLPFAAPSLSYPPKSGKGAGVQVKTCTHRWGSAVESSMTHSFDIVIACGTHLFKSAPVLRASSRYSHLLTPSTLFCPGATACTLVSVHVFASHYCNVICMRSTLKTCMRRRDVHQRGCERPSKVTGHSYSSQWCRLHRPWTQQWCRKRLLSGDVCLECASR